MKSGHEAGLGISGCVLPSYLVYFRPKTLADLIELAITAPVSNETAVRETQQVPREFVRTATAMQKEKYAL